MCTVGYGDITPVTKKEMIVCIATLIFTCGIFAHFINTMGVIFEDIVKD
jgi:hypothetical protein